MMQLNDRTHVEGSRQLRAIAGIVLALSGLSLAAMMANCSSPSTQGKSVSGLNELIQQESIREQPLQEKIAAYGIVPAHPQSESEVHRSTPTLAMRQSPLDCELAGLKPTTIDAALWTRLKLDYKQHCYKQADARVSAPQGPLAVQSAPPVEATTGSDRTRDKLETLVPSANAPASSAMGLQDSVAAPNVVAPTSTGAVAASRPPLDAKVYRERATTAYHNGDLALALIDFDLAIRLDPNFEDAYIDRGIILYRMHERNLAFDDVAQAIRIENSHQIATPPLPKASPLLK
jgi:tetratricopeptide (TPR) repeat protein